MKFVATAMFASAVLSTGMCQSDQAVAPGLTSNCAIEHSTQQVVCNGQDYDEGLLEASEDTFNQLVVGFNWGCGITTIGTIDCWDDIWGPQLPPPGRFTWLSANGFIACGVDEFGDIDCWVMETTFPEESYEILNRFSSLPPGRTWKLVDLSFRTACAMDTSGDVCCWGQDIFGENEPGVLCRHEDNFTDIAVANNVLYGVRQDGTIGYFNVPGGSQPTVVPTSNKAFKRVTAEYEDVCGLDVDGQIHCEGTTGDIVNNIPTGKAYEVSLGHRYACAAMDTGDTVCWGDPAYVIPPPL